MIRCWIFTHDCPVCRGEMDEHEARENPRGYALAAAVPPYTARQCEGCKLILLVRLDGNCLVTRRGKLPPVWSAYADTFELPPGYPLEQRGPLPPHRLRVHEGEPGRQPSDPPKGW